jgi:hypothetical protein
MRALDVQSVGNVSGNYDRPLILMAENRFNAAVDLRKHRCIRRGLQV